MKITCNKGHSGNTHLTYHHGGWECDGCGYHFTKFAVLAQIGHTPFSTEDSPAAAQKASLEAKRLGLDGRIHAY